VSGDAVSKARAIARSERVAAAARRAELDAAQRERTAAERDRKERRAMVWRRLRLWQHGPGFRRNKEKWAALATLALVVLLLTYFLTSSLGAVFLVGLVLLLVGPALVMASFERK
jgi:Flp pilus assembly protein TadB